MSPSEVYCLWLYPEDGVLTLDQFSPRLERDRVVRVTAGVSVWYQLVAIGSDCHGLGLDRIDDHRIIITPIGYLI